MKSSVTLARRVPRIVAQLEPRSKRRLATSRNQVSRNHAPTPERLMQFAWGYAPPLILEAALNCRLFDLLDRAPQTVGELAAQSGASVRGLTAILNALVGLEFLVKRGDRYALTPESAAFLVSTKPAYHGGFFRHVIRQILPQLVAVDGSGAHRPAGRCGQPPGGGPAVLCRVCRGALPAELQGGAGSGRTPGHSQEPNRRSACWISAPARGYGESRWRTNRLT